VLPRHSEPKAKNQVKIYNTLGQCVEEIPLNPPLAKGETRIDVSQLPVGVYYLKIENIVDKFMIVR